MQEAGTSTAGGGPSKAHADRNVGSVRSGSEAGRPTDAQGTTTRMSQLIALKDGDPIPEGYALVVETRNEQAASPRIPLRNACDIEELSTPPKASAPRTEEGTNTAKSKKAEMRNKTRNNNRKANATFAKELKESLATGEPMTMKVTEDQGDLKGVWHAAAKEAAYKFLDLTKETWKDYSVFEKTVVHNEVRAQYRFEPPIDIKTIDKFLSSHLRTSRAVWKAHWRKSGPSERHHNCPQVAWDKLCKWWPTAACREQAAVMAARRAKVETPSKVGRSSLVARMDEPQVDNADMEAVSF